MPSKQTVKIIKRDQRERRANPPQLSVEQSKTETQAQRDIFETITSWIEEQRETRQALYQRDLLWLKGAFE